MLWGVLYNLIPLTQRKPHEEVGTVYVLVVCWGMYCVVLYSLIPPTLGAQRKPHEEVGTLGVCTCTEGILVLRTVWVCSVCHHWVHSINPMKRSVFCALYTNAVWVCTVWPYSMHIEYEPFVECVFTPNVNVHTFACVCLQSWGPIPCILI